MPQDAGHTFCQCAMTCMRLFFPKCRSQFCFGILRRKISLSVLLLLLLLVYAERRSFILADTIILSLLRKWAMVIKSSSIHFCLSNMTTMIANSADNIFHLVLHCNTVPNVTERIKNLDIASCRLCIHTYGCRVCTQHVKHYCCFTLVTFTNVWTDW